MHRGEEKEKRENDHSMREPTQLMNSVGLTTSKQELRVIRKARKNLDFENITVSKLLSHKHGTSVWSLEFRF